MSARGGNGVWISTIAFVGIAAAVVPSRARADCAVSGYALGEGGGRARTRDGALVEAGELAANGRWPDARAVYLWMLARAGDDAEALFGLARVDAWGGCWAIAEAEFRRVLALRPGDADVRAGYVDLLVWRGRTAEARQVLGEQDATSPATNGAYASAPPLLAREAQFAYWRGDATTAVRLADEAERGAPDDGDVRAMRDRMFRGEARVTTRVDAYPGNSLVSVGGQVLGRAGLFELSGGAQLLGRFGAEGTTPIYDARYPVDVAYHPAIGVTLGAEIAPGAPAQAIPELATKAWVIFPLVAAFDGSVAYSFWHFSGGEGVHIVNPSLGMALPGEVRVEARTWISLATFGGRSLVEGAAGGQVTWSPTSRVSAGMTYTYGAEADAVAQVFPLSGTVDQFLEYRSHVAAAFADWRIDRAVGVRPVAGIERRQDPADNVAWIASVEMGVYARW